MFEPRHYKYVGSSSLLELLKRPSHRLCVTSSEEIQSWIIATQQPKEPDGDIICTFILDLQEQLWINDRRSEHVVCAGGVEVLSAGEITFSFSKLGLEVTEITNQSTGYCPEPESWSLVTKVLTKLHLPHPKAFTTAYVFRLCEQCRSINIVKDEWFVCDVCDAPLNPTWNFA